MKAQIKIDRLMSIPKGFYVLTPFRHKNRVEWKEAGSDNGLLFMLAECGYETYPYRILPNGEGYIDTQSRLVRKLNCPRCNLAMRPYINSYGWLEPLEYTCKCGMKTTIATDE